MKKSKLFIIGGITIIILALLCFLAPLYIQWDPEEANLLARLTPPEWFKNGLGGHILGTDALGRDILARLLYGGRTSLVLAVVVVLISTAIGVVLGVVSGYFGGLTDAVIMRLCDIMASIPSLLLAVCIVAVLGSSMVHLAFVLIITSWVVTARVSRGNVFSIMSSDYVKASKVIGASNLRIMVKEVLPNIVTPVIITSTQHLGGVVLNETSLSFLGMGVPLPAPSWGTMISDGREYIASAPWVVIVPGIALMITVLAFDFLGDGLTDIINPRNTD